MPKPKKCKVCKEPFTPWNTAQQPCSPKCALILVRNAERRAFKAETRKMKAKAKGKKEWLKEAQSAFNKYIRIRDKARPCISCGRYHQGQYHAGHYRTVGSTPELRFHLYNCWKQCAPCNNQLSGNIIEYRKRLSDRLGREGIEWLEGPHDPKHYTIDDLKEIKQGFNEWAKELENETN